jgi:hypothetical protein
VQESISIAPVNLQNGVPGTFGIPCKPTRHLLADTAGQHIYQERANEFEYELEEEIEHAGIMALTGQIAKTGKA